MAWILFAAYLACEKTVDLEIVRTKDASSLFGFGRSLNSRGWSFGRSFGQLYTSAIRNEALVRESSSPHLCSQASQGYYCRSESHDSMVGKVSDASAVKDASKRSGQGVVSPHGITATMR